MAYYSMLALGGAGMTDLIWLSYAQMVRIEPYFTLLHGVPCVDDRKVISGIIFVIRNGLRWRDAPREYGPHKTIYNRFVRWCRLCFRQNLCCTGEQRTQTATFNDRCHYNHQES
jgi:transposase